MIGARARGDEELPSKEKNYSGRNHYPNWFSFHPGFIRGAPQRQKRGHLQIPSPRNGPNSTLQLPEVAAGHEWDMWGPWGDGTGVRVGGPPRAYKKMLGW